MRLYTNMAARDKPAPLQYQSTKYNSNTECSQLENITQIKHSNYNIINI